MSEDKKELDVYEARTINKQYSDDSFYAIVDFNEDGIGKIRECPHCLEYGFHYKLGHRIKKKNEPPVPDDDQFLSCCNCCSTFGIHETFQEAKIKDSLETVQNPFENEFVFLSTDSRREQRRKGKKHKSRFKVGEHEDSDIQTEIDKGLAVKILYDFGE